MARLISTIVFTLPFKRFIDSMNSAIQGGNGGWELGPCSFYLFHFLRIKPSNFLLEMIADNGGDMVDLIIAGRW